MSGRSPAFSGAIDVPAGGEAVVVRGPWPDRLAEAAKLSPLARDPLFAFAPPRAAARPWVAVCVRVKTNRPDFDRLVNDWLPYQLLAARLWGRTGPSQRSGATGYRDQLQDVIPLFLLTPGRAPGCKFCCTRRTSLSRATRSNGGTGRQWRHGLGDRTHASDPHLWLPYVALRYVNAGDAVLDESSRSSKPPPVPQGAEAT